MKNPFNLSVARLFVGLVAFAGSYLAVRAQSDAGGSVLSPGKRQELIDQAKKLLAPREGLVVSTDPFHPEGFDELVAEAGRPAGTTGATQGEAAPAQPTGPRTDHDLLAAIGAGLRPSGFFVIGGQPTLLFGQKRVKAGGSLTITFEGAQYTLEITAVNPPNFTLRLNREEFTRTIK